MFSKFSGAPRVIAADLPEVIAGRLQRVRNTYARASERLFELCFEIQATGKLPEPVSLTQAVIAYHHARALLEALNVGTAHKGSTGNSLGMVR